MKLITTLIHDIVMMHTRFVLISLLTFELLYCPFVGLCQNEPEIVCDFQEEGPPNTGLEFAPNGRHCTPKGDLLVLIVFVGFEGYQGLSGASQPSLGPSWNNSVSPGYELPSYLNYSSGNITTHGLIYNNYLDFEDSQLNSTYPVNISNTLQKMSNPNENFRIIAKVFSDNMGTPRMVVLDPSQLTNPQSFSDVNTKAFEKMWDINNDPNYYRQFDNRINNPNYLVDNSINTQSDDKIDFIVFVYRYSRAWNDDPIVGMTTWAGAGGGITGPGSHSFNGIGYDAGFVIAHGGGNHKQIFVHEFAHSIYHMAHVAGTNGVVGSYFGIPVTGIGSTAALPMFEPMLSSWERWYVGYIDPIEVNADGVYEIRDYVTSGEAMRIALPFTGSQKLWLEYHNREDDLDNHPFRGINIGPEINGESVTLGNSATGIYLYVENIASNRNSTGFSAITNNGANGFKYINATGNWNYAIDNSAGTKTNSWNQTLKKYVREEDFAIDGQNIWYSHVNDDDGNGSISFNTNYNRGSIETSSGVTGFAWEEVNEQEYGFYRSWGMSDIAPGMHAPTMVVGDKLDISSNPVVLNHPKYSSTNSSFDPYVLNGVSIEMLSEENGIAEIKVQFKETNLKSNRNWSGNIVLPNISENSSGDLIINENITLNLALSDKIDRASLSTETGLFKNPTILRVSSGAKLQIKAGAKLVVKENSKLILEAGGEIEVLSGGQLIIEENGELIMHSTNLKLPHLESQLIVKGKIITQDAIDFTFTGLGYVTFYNTHELDLGAGSAFRMKHSLGIQNEELIVLKENTTLEIQGHNTYIESGKVVYEPNTSIEVASSDLLFIDFSKFESTSINDGLIISDVEEVQIKKTIFTGFDNSLICHNVIELLLDNDDFINCETGLNGAEIDIVEIESSTWDQISESGITIDDARILSMVSSAIRNCNEDGIIMTDVNEARIDMTEIHDTDVAIRMTRSNTFLGAGTSIHNNETGIHGISYDKNYLLSIGRCGCVEVINNNLGIYGLNLILDIDAFQHQMECNYEERFPNRFDGNATMFDVCYNSTDFMPAVIMARGNYWGGQPLYAYTYNAEFNNCQQEMEVWSIPYINSLQGLTSCEEVPPMDPNFPAEYPETNLDMIECFYQTGSGIISMHNTFKAAFIDFLTLDRESALDEFTEVAEMPTEEIEDNDQCLSINYIAKTMVDLLEEYQGSPLAATSNSSSPTSNEHDRVMKTEKDNYAMQLNLFNDLNCVVYDLNGNIVLENANVINIDAIILPSGIYVLALFDKNKNLISTQKFVSLN